MRQHIHRHRLPEGTPGTVGDNRRSSRRPRRLRDVDSGQPLCSDRDVVEQQRHPLAWGQGLPGHPRRRTQHAFFDLVVRQRIDCGDAGCDRLCDVDAVRAACAEASPAAVEPRRRRGKANINASIASGSGAPVASASFHRRRTEANADTVISTRVQLGAGAEEKCEPRERVSKAGDEVAELLLRRVTAVRLRRRSSKSGPATTLSTGSPATNLAICERTRCAARGRNADELPPTCGEMRTPGTLHSG